MDSTICTHTSSYFENWPDGGMVEICSICGKSQYIWEQGNSPWITVKNIQEVRRKLEQEMNNFKCKREQEINNFKCKRYKPVKIDSEI